MIAARACRPAFLLMALFFSAASAFGQARVEMRIPAPEEIVLGRPFLLVVEATGEDPASLRFEDRPDLGPHIRILAHLKDEERPGLHQYRIFACRIGRLILPGMKVHTKDGESLRTNTVEIEVRSPLKPGEADLREPDLLRPLPEEGSRTALFIIAALLLAGAGTLTWMRIRRGRVSTSDEPPSPGQEALRALARLEQQRPETPQAMDDYYVTLSFILRCYIRDQFEVAALEKTTDEILRGLHAPGRPAEEGMASLGGLLDRCDKIKFTDRAADPSQATEDLKAAVHFVRDLHETREGKEGA